MQTEDGSIISKCLNGEPEAFGILVDKYKSGIYAFVYTKLNDFRDAQDVTQDVFVEAFCKLHSLKRWESFAFWLYRIASNLCKRWIRTKIRHPEPEFIEDQNPLEIDSTAISSYRDDQMNLLIREAMDSLPEIYREILLLYYFGGMNSNEIARALGISPTAILQRLTRARAQLREDIIGMIGATFNEKRLGSGFTFHIVEAVKRLKINPVSTIKGLPWGISLATVLMGAVLSINPHLTNFDWVSTSSFLSSSSEAKVLEVGEFPVNILNTSQTPNISKGISEGKGSEQLGMQNALFMSPQAEGGKWIKKADMLTARYGMSASVVDENIYVIGGYDNSFLNTVEMYDSIHDKWEMKASLSQGNLGVGTASANGKIYAIGGWNSNGQYLNTVEEYDPLKDTWTRKANMPTARAWVSAAVVDDIIHAIGGMDSTGNFTSVVEAYDPVADQWNSKANLPVASECWTAVVGHKLYAMGLGIGCADVCPLPDVYEYDSMLNTWSKKADMPTTRYAIAPVAINEKIYAVGGVSSFNPYRIVSTVEIYDPKTDTWEKGINLPDAIGYHVGAVVDGRIYIIGGADEWQNPNVPPNLVSSTVEVFDTGLSISPQGKLPNTWGKIKAK